MKSKDPVKLGENLGSALAKTIENFKYFRPNRKFVWKEIKELKQPAKHTEDEVKRFCNERMKRDQEHFIIKNTLEVFCGMITVPHFSREEEILSFIYEAYMEDMESFMQLTRAQSNGWGMLLGFDMKDVAQDYEAFRIQMQIVKGFVEKACKKMMIING